MSITMTKQWLTPMIYAVLTLALAGCDGASNTPSDSAGDGDNERVGDNPASDAPGPGDDTAPEAPALAGRWEAISQNGTVIRDGELTFTFHADGTGMSLEGTSEKAFTWSFDAEAVQLRVVTGNEDLLFDVAMAGSTLSLVTTVGEEEMRLLLRRLEPDAE